MVNGKELLKRIEDQEKRISFIEDTLNLERSAVKPAQEEEVFEPVQESFSEEKVNLPSISFNQVITFLGVLGIIIGAISFFFYAVANHWIGETAQVGIGVLLGFVLFALAYNLRAKKEQWSNIVFGGAYFIEYLAIGIGVLEYKVLPEILGLFLCTAFLISSFGLNFKFKSRMIGYFSLVGGYLIPFITGTYSNDLFILSFYLILSIALVLVSFKFNWADLRLVSFAFLNLFIVSSLFKFIDANSKIIPILFLIIIFVLYNLASLIGSLRNNNKLPILDSVVIGFLPLTFLSFLYAIIDIEIEYFGLIVMLLSFVYLIEIAYFKMKKEKMTESLTYTLLSTGFITLNLGLVFLLNSINEDFLMVLFVVQWLLFAKLSEKMNEKSLYKFFSNAFLILTMYWYIALLRFDHGLLHATFFLGVLALIVYGFYHLFSKNIDYKINAAGFLCSGYLFIYSFFKYLAFFINSDPFREIVLSILWLCYCLFMFSKVPSKEGKTLVGVLLSITLIKIAFVDLLFLEGAFRIIGFIVFGILLLIGGYFIKNEDKK